MKRTETSIPLENSEINVVEVGICQFIPWYKVYFKSTIRTGLYITYDTPSKTELLSLIFKKSNCVIQTCLKLVKLMMSGLTLRSNYKKNYVLFS